MSTEQLFEMLLECRLNNRRSHLTGLLLFCGESFLQILEGPEENVGSIYKKICTDTRHKDVKVLYKKEISTRSFGNWEMSFKRLSNLNMKSIRGFSSFIQEGLSLQQLNEYSEPILEALNEFRDTHSQQ
jgi:hypothetical protein